MRPARTARLHSLVVIWLALHPGVVAQVIPISGVEALYSAVNDPANAGATLVLAPGTYILSATNPSNAPRPKGGRIELQPDMSMIGVEGDRGAVVINASALPASSFPQTAGPNAAIRMGLGHNALEWLTVVAALNAQANIDAGLHGGNPGTAYVELAHVASGDALRGLNLINYGLQQSGQTIEADIVDSYFYNNVGGAGEGLRFGSFVGASRGTVNVRMSGNVSWGNLSGLIIENARAQDSTVNVISSGDLFYDNQTGTILAAGLSTNNTRADGNTINFEAHGDRFLDNTMPSNLDQGGLLVIASENASAVSGGGSNNTVNISLWGCRMLNNARSDLTVIGARSPSTSLASFSQNNHVTIEINGAGDDNQHGTWQPVEVFTNTLVGGVPGFPDYGNSVTVVD